MPSPASAQLSALSTLAIPAVPWPHLTLAGSCTSQCPPRILLPLSSPSLLLCHFTCTCAVAPDLAVVYLYLLGSCGCTHCHCSTHSPRFHGLHSLKLSASEIPPIAALHPPSPKIRGPCGCEPAVWGRCSLFLRGGNSTNLHCVIQPYPNQSHSS